MEKARSRLRSLPEKNEQQPAPKTVHAIKKPKHQFTVPGFFIKYVKHIPALGIGLIGYGGLYHVFTNLKPYQIQNIFIPNAYLPVVLLFLLANFFFFSFLLLNSRRGWMVSVYLTFLFFLRLQAVTYNPLVIGAPLIIFALLESTLIVLKSKSQHEK